MKPLCRRHTGNCLKCLRYGLMNCKEVRKFINSCTHKYVLHCSHNLALASVLLSLSTGHFLVSNKFKLNINTLHHKHIFPPSDFYSLGNPANLFCANFFVLRATFSTHLVLHTTNGVLKSPRRCLLVYRTSGRNIVVKYSISKIGF